MALGQQPVVQTDPHPGLGPGLLVQRRPRDRRALSQLVGYLSATMPLERAIGLFASSAYEVLFLAALLLVETLRRNPARLRGVAVVPPSSSDAELEALVAAGVRGLAGSYRTSSAGGDFADTLPFAHALVEKAPDRLVWGSDWPHVAVPGRMPNDGELVDLLAAWVPDAAARERILVDNPRRLYGFPP